MDSIIKVLTFLFVLSMISEKLVSLIRRYPRKTLWLLLSLSIYTLILSGNSIRVAFKDQAGTNTKASFIFLLIFSLLLLAFQINLLLRRRGRGYALNWLSSPFNNIEKNITLSNKVQQEKEITLLSVIAGFFIAFISNASLFHLIVLDPKEYNPLALTNIFDSWIQLNQHISYDVATFIGLLTTGFFLSFGSKFFHDILELVFQIKNSQKRLSKLDLKNADSVEDLISELEIAHQDIVDIVYNREKEEVFKTEGVNGISISKVNWNGEELPGIKITTQRPGNISFEKFRYTRPGKGSYQVPVKVVESNIASICSGIIPSGILKNQDSTKTGSLCFPFKDEEGQNYFITCYHVVKHADHSWNRFRTNNHEHVTDEHGELLGEITRVCFNDTIDAALVQADSEIDTFQTKIGDLEIDRIKTANSNDVNSITVKFKSGKAQGIKSGHISGIKGIQKIKFDDSLVKSLSNLIELQDGNGGPLVESGDSGSLVYSERGEAIGMVVATDDKESFAIPISAIAKEFEIELYKNPTS